MLARAGYHFQRPFGLLSVDLKDGVLIGHAFGMARRLLSGRLLSVLL